MLSRADTFVPCFLLALIAIGFAMDSVVRRGINRDTMSFRIRDSKIQSLFYLLFYDDSRTCSNVNQKVIFFFFFNLVALSCCRFAIFFVFIENRYPQPSIQASIFNTLSIMYIYRGWHDTSFVRRNGNEAKDIK